MLNLGSARTWDADRRHCLFHALEAGGLLDDIPESLTVQELRDLAIASATPERLAIAAAGAGGVELSVEDYVAGMRGNAYGDNLFIALLAQCFQRDICVVRRDYIRTYLSGGGEINEAVKGAIWIAHIGEAHYYGIFRTGQVPVTVDKEGSAWT